MASGTNIATAYVHLVPSFKGVAGSIQQAFSGSGAQAGDAIGKSLASKMKTALIAAGVGKILGDTIKASLEAGGALQQSFGGLETLYGDAADAAKQYAMEAAQAGIDANTYAEQAVSFGAALKSAFGGDTQKAMEAANTAIMDMADNSAKMGTDISSIQAAYQGFAKQNYTMLDNLKLGYGGTKTEMERLLKDAEKLTGIKYDINNLGDVYAAIHAIQEELGVAGVAAKEANTTLTGSMNALKASFQNLMASMSLGLDLTEPITQIIQSAGALLFNNLIPMVGNIFKAMPQVIIAAARQIMPTIQQGITALLNGEIGNTIMIMTAGFMAKIPDMMQTGFELLKGLVQGIISNVPQILVAAAGVIAQFAAAVATNLPTILQKGIEIIGELAAGIISAIPDLIRQIPQVFNQIKARFAAFDWRSIGGDIIKGIANGITSAAGEIASAAKEAAQRALDAAKNALGIHSPSTVMEKQVGEMISAGIAVGIEKSAYKIDDAMADVSALNLAGYSMSGANVAPGVFGGYNQTIVVNSPTALTPSEIARQTKNATQQMALAMSGVY